MVRLTFSHHFCSRKNSPKETTPDVGGEGNFSFYAAVSQSNAGGLGQTGVSGDGKKWMDLRRMKEKNQQDLETGEVVREKEGPPRFHSSLGNRETRQLMKPFAEIRNSRREEV